MFVKAIIDAIPPLNYALKEEECPHFHKNGTLQTHAEFFLLVILLASIFSLP